MFCAPMYRIAVNDRRASVRIVASCCWRRCSPPTVAAPVPRARARLGVAAAHEQQVERQIGRPHAPGGIQARGQHEADVKAVELRVQQTASLQKGLDAGRVRAGRQAAEAAVRDHAILADERHDVGQRADRSHLDEVRQRVDTASAREEQSLHELQRDAHAGEVLVRIGAVGALRIDHREAPAAAQRPGSWWSVMMRSTPRSSRAAAASSAECRSPPRRSTAAPAACSRSIGLRLQAVAVLDDGRARNA